MTSKKAVILVLLTTILTTTLLILYRIEKTSYGITFQEVTPAETFPAAKSPAEYRRKLKQQNPDHPGLYDEIMRLRKTPSDLEAPAYPSNYQYDELGTLQKRRRNVRTKSVQWTSRGPANVPGRTRSLVVMEEDPTGNTWLAGSVGGGIWFTSNAGQSWENRTPDLLNLATTSVVRSVSNPDVFYVGTGESFASPGSTTGSNGSGMFKSTNGGQTFFQLTSTATDPRFRNINRIIISPQNENILLACTIGFFSVSQPDDPTSYILKSIDGGINWTPVIEIEAEVQQLLASPDNFDVQYASVRGFGILKSIDQGETWEFSSNGLTSSGRIEMAISPANPNRIFAYAEGGTNGTDVDLWISNNAAETWMLTREENGQQNIDNLLQGNYDNVIMGHPFNENIAYFGGVDMFKAVVSSNMAGTAFSISSALFNTGSFLDFVNFGGSFLNGGGTLGPVPQSQLKAVEIRFGPGISQNAHRFTVPATSGSAGNGSSGVPDNEYEYQDYVSVPFQAWDVSVEPARQLMVSFRDQERNGQWDLTALNDPTEGREYIYVQDIDYDPAVPDPSVTVDGGHVIEQMYFIWPVSATGSATDVSALPESRLALTPEETQIVERSTINLSDARNTFPSNSVNGFDQAGQFGTTSQDGGLHPDHHFLQAINVNASTQTFRIINCNDGGVYITNASTTPGEQDGDWIFSGTGYNTGQFYGAVKQPGADVYTGGLQDNGTWTSQVGENANDNSLYLRSGFGDGFESAWNAADADLLVVSSQFNNFLGSRNAGQGNFNLTYAADFGLTDSGPFVSRLAYSPQNPDVLFTVGSTGVWRSKSFGQDQWELIPISDQWAFNNITDVEVSLADPSIVWAGGRMDDSGSLFVSTDGGDSFSEAVDYTTVTLGACSGIYTHPTQPNTAYALFSFADRPKVLRTTDLGQTWVDISGFESSVESTNGFPDVAVNTLLVHPNDPNTLWVGTEIGIVESTDNGASWQFLDGDLPRASVWQLKAVENRIVAATHGRGIWTTDISPAQPSAFIPNIVDAVQTTSGGLILVVRLYEIYDNLQLFLDDEPLGTLNVPEQTGLFSYEIPLPEFPVQNQIIELRLDGTTGSTAVSSVPKQLELFGLTVQDQYSNNFNTLSQSDFLLSGFSIAEVTNFPDGALHSPHPYPDFTAFTAQLMVPIRVAGPGKAQISFDNVALLETGGTVTDFVIVEGSTDGLNWQELGPGYDAGENSDWLDVLNDENSNDGTSDLFETTEYNLLNTFNQGDTIFVRFRLFADQSNPNDDLYWGWAIDNLRIQTDEFVTSVEEGFSGERFRIYPNPIANNVVEGQYRLSSASEVSLEIIDMNGRLIATDFMGTQLPGTYPFRLNIPGQETGVYLVKLRSREGENVLRVLKLE